MMVKPGYRGIGIGSALVERAIAWAKMRDLPSLNLGVFPHNEAAIALYERHGFVETRREHGAFRRQAGEHWDLIRMTVQLRQP